MCTNSILGICLICSIVSSTWLQSVWKISPTVILAILYLKFFLFQVPELPIFSMVLQVEMFMFLWFTQVFHSSSLPVDLFVLQCRILFEYQYCRFWYSSCILYLFFWVQNCCILYHLSVGSDYPLFVTSSILSERSFFV